MQLSEWDAVVEEIGPRLFRYFKYRGAQDLASDLTQETFIRLLVKMGQYDKGRGSVTAFALGVAQNIWMEHRRKHRHFENIDDHAEIAADENLLEKIATLDEGQRLMAIVARLPSIQQDILYFYFDEEITTREIGEILRMPEGTVKSHIHRAKETLKPVLSKETL